MRIVNMHEAKSQLSKLVAAVESGAEDAIVIARNGKPSVKLTSVVAERRVGGIKFGLAKGRFQAPADLDANDDEIARLFNDSPLFPRP